MGPPIRVSGWHVMQTLAYVRKHTDPIGWDATATPVIRPSTYWDRDET
jgi:hypothetical protein